MYCNTGKPIVQKKKGQVLFFLISSKEKNKSDYFFLHALTTNLASLRTEIFYKKNEIKIGCAPPLFIYPRHAAKAKWALEAKEKGSIIVPCFRGSSDVHITMWNNPSLNKML